MKPRNRQNEAREQIRAIARQHNVPRGRNEADTRRNLRLAGVSGAMTPGKTTIDLDARELATVLASLRYWQERQPAFDELDSIATDGGTMEQLSAAEIDGLCERLNR